MLLYTVQFVPSYYLDIYTRLMFNIVFYIILIVVYAGMVLKNKETFFKVIALRLILPNYLLSADIH